MLNRAWHPCWDADPGWAQRNWAVGTGNWMKPKGPGQWTPDPRSASNACSKHLLQHFWGQRAHPFKAAHALGGPFLYRGQTIAFNIQPFLPVPTSQHCVRQASALLDPRLLYSQATTISFPCTLPIRHLEEPKVSALGGHGGQHGAQPPRDQVKHNTSASMSAAPGAHWPQWRAPIRHTCSGLTSPYHPLYNPIVTPQ